MKIGLASPHIATSLEEGLATVEQLLANAAAQGAKIVCFPEAYLPGLRGQDFDVLPFEQPEQERVLQAVSAWGRTYGVAVILGMERLTAAGRENVAVVIDAQGQIRATRPRTSCIRPKRRSMCPGRPGASSRSTGCGSVSRSAMRAGAIPIGRA
ncbi:MAG: hypothetical protein HGA45_18520 [Chloroflexales bacterium]|nr:hypothetical protein [Chloroflexales bacterium]